MFIARAKGFRTRLFGRIDRQKGLGKAKVLKERPLMSRGQSAGGAKTLVPVFSVGLGQQFWYLAATVVEVELRLHF